MKKSILFLCIVLLLTCFAVTFSATGTIVTVNNETAYRGETVSFSATLNENVEVGSGSIALSYDSAVLELVEGSWNVSGTMMAPFYTSNGKGSFAFENTGTVSGVLFTATFKVKDTAMFGTTDVAMNITLRDGNSTDITLVNNVGSITVKCNHSFTKQDTEYLMSEASCTSLAVYYKSCETCGEKGTETFELAGSLTAHSYTAADKKAEALKTEGNCRDKAVYWYSCASCGKVENNDNHTFEGDKVADKHVGGTETVNATQPNHNTQIPGYSGDTKCLGCNEIIEYGQTIPAEAHVPSDTWSYDGTNHWQICSVDGCGVIIEGSTSAHNSTDENVATCQKVAICDVCAQSYGTVADHDMADATCTEPATCKRGCGHTEGVANGHAPKTGWFHDKVSHWIECDNCTEKLSMDIHTKSEEYIEESYDRIYTCTVCGCEIRETMHTHSYLDSGWNTHYHWKECECGDVKDVATHGWFYAGVIKHPTETETGLGRYVCICGGYYDVVIETLEHTHVAGQTWKSDDSAHWNECACGEPVNAEFHSWNGGVEKDDAKVYTCTVCGAEKREDLPKHEHAAAGHGYKHDDLTHWQECSCGEKIDEGAHVWVTDRVEDGVIYIKCAVCDATVETPDRVDSYDEAPTRTPCVYATGLLVVLAAGIILLSQKVKQR